MDNRVGPQVVLQEVHIFVFLLLSRDWRQLGLEDAVEDSLVLDLFFVVNSVVHGLRVSEVVCFVKIIRHFFL